MPRRVAAATKGDVFVDGASKREAVDLAIHGSGDLHYAAAGGVAKL